jgi:hypothetical protein
MALMCDISMMALLTVTSVITLMTMELMTALKYKLALRTMKTDVPDDLDVCGIHDGLGACDFIGVWDGHDRDV